MHLQLSFVFLLGLMFILRDFMKPNYLEISSYLEGCFKGDESVIQLESLLVN